MKPQSKLTFQIGQGEIQIIIEIFFQDTLNNYLLLVRFWKCDFLKIQII